MSKFNAETCFADISKKLAALTTKISEQSTLIEAQNKKIEAQQRAIDGNYITLTEQMRVLGNLNKKIDELLSLSTDKSKTDNPTGNVITQSASEKAADTEVNLMSQNTMTDRARRAAERANKGVAIGHKRERLMNMDKNDDAEAKETTTSKASGEWKVVRSQKNTKKIQQAIQTGGNQQIHSFQAVEKKKFLHVWSLHPDTKEEAIAEHVSKLCGSKDVKVEKIVPKTKRDYSSFMIGVPELVFEKINSADSWPLNARFNEWIWFRNFRHSGKVSENR